MDTTRLFQRKGFTLIELLIGLAIMSVMVGGVFFSFRLADRATLQQVSYGLQADLRYAQRRAMIEGCQWGIVFDVIENQYRLVYVDDMGWSVIEKTISLPSGVRLVETSHVSVLYLPRGTPNRGFGGTLANDRYWQRFTITPAAGRVELKEILPINNGDIPLVY